MKLGADFQSAASPFPQVEIKTSLAPGKRGPVGTGPRNDFSRVNSGAPPVPDTGAGAQKSLAPDSAGMLQKAASEDSMATTMAARPTINEMVKKAMAGAMKGVDISREAARQAGSTEETKVASATTASAAVPLTDSDKAEKLAAALSYVASELSKEGASLGGAYHLAAGRAAVGEGPGALQVTESNVPGKDPFKPGNQGHGHSHQVAAGPALQKSNGPGPATQLENNMASPAGFHEHQGVAMVNQKGTKVAMEKCSKCGEVHEGECKEKKASIAESARAAFAKVAGTKTAGEEAEKKETEGLAAAKKGVEEAEKAHKSEPENKGKEASAFTSLADALRQHVKTAEDAINPAHISAGAAVPPDTRQAGQPGGISAKGSGPGMVASAQGAIHYTKGQAKAEPKNDLGTYFKEPALTSATDKTLGMAFSHTGQAGTKLGSAGGAPAGDPSVKTAAARALLQKLAAAAEEKKTAEQGS